MAETVTLTEPESEWQATQYIFNGLGFFLKNHFKKTLAALLCMFGSLGFFAYDYTAHDKADLIEQVTSDDKNAPESDSEFQITKVPGKATLNIYDNVTHKKYQISVPVLGDKIKQSRKG